MLIEYVVYGIPRPKKRPRVFRGKGGRIYAINPSKTDEEDIVSQILKKRPKKPITGPVSVSITFSLPIPKSSSKIARQRMRDGIELHTKKPDLDNLVKLVLDSINGVVIADDSQIWSISTVKKYGEVPSTRIKISF